MNRAETISIVREGAVAESSALPSSLLKQGSRRLQAMSLVLLGVLAVGWVGVNSVEGEFLDEFRNPVDWGPATLMIASSLAILILTRGERLRPETIITAGLCYEVLVSFCMPLSQYWDAFRGVDTALISRDLVGISWVAVWMLGFSVMVPSRPRSALIALSLSGSAVPLTIGALIWAGNAPTLTPLRFFFIFVLPYMIVMELLDGLDLESPVRKRGPLGPVAAEWRRMHGSSLAG